MPTFFILDFLPILSPSLKVDLKHRTYHIEPVATPLQLFPFLRLFQARDLHLECEEMSSEKLQELFVLI